MILHFSKDKDLGTKISTKVKDALTKLTESSYEDESVWFVVTKNAGTLDSTHTNYHILNLFNAASKIITIPSTTLLKYRNYFYQKAVGAQNLKELGVSLKALSKLDYIPFIKSVGNSVVSDKKISFELVDLLNQPF